MIDRLHILMVEDNAGDADLIRDLLPADGPDGVEIKCVPRLTAALECVRSDIFNIILLDLGLPDSNGLDSVRAMRHGAPALPIVVLTGNQDEQIGLSAIKEGAQDYLVKGQFRKNQLMRALRYAVERKGAEKSLLRMVHEWQRTFDSMSEAVWIIDKNNTVLRSNKAAGLYFRMPCAEMAGKHCWEIVHGTTQPIPECPILRAKKSLQHERMELQIGEDWFDITVDPILDMDGQFDGAVHITTKITERKIAEEEHEKLESQFRQSQKMESIGRLAGGIAHDFNNMLSIINGYSELILGELPTSDPNYFRIQEIGKAGERSADLTRQLLAFARKQVISTKVLNINDNVDGMLKMLSRILGEDVELSWNPGPSLWKVKMDSSQIDQLLANLLVNARDAISGNGKVTIETGRANVDKAFCKTHPDSVPGKYILLSVSDNGCGIDKEKLQHIFEPFFTTKKIGEGTGLGLSTVFGIVKQNKGFINVHSEPGKGTTFKIYLPRHEPEYAESDEESEPSKIFRGTGTVLVVEDEESLLLIVKILIERLGYTVLSTSSPFEAIKIAEKYKEEIHLLMTDVIMPGISGSDLQKRISSLRPGIKCLFMSGYAADIISHNGILDEGVHFLQKPFTEEDLSAKLREAICPPKKS